MALVQRLIDVQISLANGVFDGGGNRATLSGLRVSCKIVNAGAPSMGTAEIAVFGMTLSQMNQLSAVGTQINVQSQNSITIQAGDTDSGMSTVFQGTITTAWVDANAQPQVAFRILAVGGGINAVQTANPTSFNGSTDVATVLQQLASQMGLTFEGNGVSVQISNPYFWGSPLSQVRDACAAANVQFTIENGVLAIWKTGTPRQGDAVMISPDTGMVGYPEFNQANVRIRTLFNPSLKLGGKITVQSSLQPACGDWTVFSIGHDLESNVPHGKWFSTVEAQTIGSY